MRQIPQDESEDEGLAHILRLIKENSVAIPIVFFDEDEPEPRPESAGETFARIISEKAERDADEVEGYKGDQYLRELTETINRAQDYLDDRMSRDELTQLRDFIMEGFLDDFTYTNSHVWFFLAGIGFMLDRRFE